MNKQIGNLLVFVGFLFFGYSQSQEQIENKYSETTFDVFTEDPTLPIKLSYSIKDIKKNTNDSTYIDSDLIYQSKDGIWQTLPVKLRRRGNYRLKNCYFPPLKVKVKKSDSKNTLFEGHKNLKIVLPCLLQNDNNDNVVKEYLAYKFFEIISPNYYKTRLLDIEFEEERGNKSKLHHIKGILIEDDKNVAKRLNGKVYERDMHPLNQEAMASVRNAFFQYMIGNTDFSQAYQHNITVIYANQNMIPIPFDFDMSGFVNTSYAVVSEINGESLGMSSVTDRKYRGFVRDINIYEQVRQEFLNKKSEMLSALDENASFFTNSNEFETAKEYILSFYEVLVNNSKFKSEIVDQARTN